MRPQFRQHHHQLTLVHNYAGCIFRAAKSAAPLGGWACEENPDLRGRYLELITRKYIIPRLLRTSREPRRPRRALRPAASARHTDGQVVDPVARCETWPDRLG